LDFSKIEAGKLDFETIEFDLISTVEDAAQVFSAQAQDKEVALMYRLAPELPHRIKGDPGRLRQVLTNLVGNALKFTEHGEVVVGAELVEERDGQALIAFEVRDTGIGISEDHLKHIFEAFTQADTSTTRRFGGTGLGLAITIRLIQMMGGEIKVSSTPGAGSVFRFQLSFELGKSPAPRRVQPCAVEGLAVLIVDDNQTNRRILSETLGSWRMRVFEADSAGAALEAAIINPPGLVLMDAQMPEMDGFATTKMLRKLPSCKNVPVLMLSSMGSRGDGKRAHEAGCSGYLTKPVRRSALFDAIQMVLSPNENQEQPLITRHIVREAGALSGTLLLVEDNPVNRRVATGMLTKLGHQVTEAQDGVEALEKLASGKFDLVLMDVQMPNMDGFEATRRIRQEQRYDTLPIVAMTAHALKGDRERCLAVGMDDYLTKPIRADELKRIVERWLRAPRQSSDPPATASEPQGDAFAVLDLPQALERMLGDRELLADAVSLLREDIPGRLSRLEAALREGALPDVNSAAHSIKGAVANLGADAMAESAKELEFAARDGDMPRATRGVARVIDDWEALLEALTQAGL
jgi:CheY-like chemotaxis protein/HPt (histidine-containing phosphotransfer) domain-containing protein